MNKSWGMGARFINPARMKCELLSRPYPEHLSLISLSCYWALNSLFPPASQIPPSFRSDFITASSRQHLCSSFSFDLDTRMFSYLLDISVWRPQAIQTKYGCLFLRGYFPSWSSLMCSGNCEKQITCFLTLFKDKKNGSLERLSNLSRAKQVQHLESPPDSKVPKLGVDSF